MRTPRPLYAAALVGVLLLASCHDPAAPGLHHQPVPAPVPGSSTVDIAPADFTPYYSDGVGVIRTFCTFSHAAHHDPIVAPGGYSHLHSFFGNTAADADTTDPRAEGDSTCPGGIANRSLYWTPTLLDLGDVDAEQNPGLVDTYNAFGPHTGWQDQFALDGNLGNNVYYKTGYKGVPAQAVEWFPAGLRMVAGNTANITAGWSGPTAPEHARFNCIHPRNTGESLFGSFDHIPTEAEDGECTVGNILVTIVVFPQCWNGTDTDSPDHRSHMAYATPGIGCPASHPRELPEVSYHIRQGITAENYPTANWRLSSDVYPQDMPGGMTLHADWWNGWDPAIGARFVAACYQPGLDCRGEYLGPNPVTGVPEALV